MGTTYYAGNSFRYMLRGGMLQLDKMKFYFK